MWRDLKSVVLLALVPAIAGLVACLNDASPPPLQGPSELGVSIEMRANPFLLVSDGQSSSVIEAVVRDQNGQRKPNVVILFDIRVTGTQTFRSYLDLGCLAPQGAPQPQYGGAECVQSAATTGGDGVARVVYWAPYRTDQANDIIITIIGRPGTLGTDVDYRTAVARTVDIFLRAADRPSFPGGAFCSFIIEPQQNGYRVGQQIFFTATQSVGGSGFPIARYEWDFGDGIGTANGRTASYVYTIPNLTTGYAVILFTTESITGAQTACLNSVQPILYISP